MIPLFIGGPPVRRRVGDNLSASGETTRALRTSSRLAVGEPLIAFSPSPITKLRADPLYGFSDVTVVKYAYTPWDREAKDPDGDPDPLDVRDDCDSLPAGKVFQAKLRIILDGGGLKSGKFVSEVV